MDNIDDFIISLKDLFSGKIEEESVKFNEPQAIKFLNVSLNNIWENLSNTWSLRDKRAIDFYEAYIDFQNRNEIWKEIVGDSGKMEDLDFILKYAKKDKWFSKTLEDGEFNDELIQHEKNTILKNPPVFVPREYLEKQGDFKEIFSFKFYHDYPLKINIHLQLTKSWFYSFVIFFTIVIDYVDTDKEFSIKDINQQYNTSIISKKLFKQLKKLGYKEVDSIYAGRENYLYTYDPKDSLYPNYVPEVIPKQTPPFLFRCFYVNLLHYSIEELFTHLSKNLKKIQKTVVKNSNIGEPQEFYRNYEQEVRNFIEKGKNLLSISNDMFYEKQGTEKNIHSKFSKKTRLNIEKIYRFLEREYQSDKEDEGVQIEDWGYRSIKNIFDINKDSIDESWATYNKYSKEILQQRNKFESRKRNKAGGGIEYRIKTEIETGKENRNKPKDDFLEADEDEDEPENLIRVEEAFLYETDGQIDKALDIYLDIFNTYPEEIEEYSWLFCNITSKIGDLYLEQGKLDISGSYYERAKEMRIFGDRDEVPYLISILKIILLKGTPLGPLLEQVESLESSLKKAFNKIITELNEKYQFEDKLMLEEVDGDYLQELEYNPKIPDNNPDFQILLRIDKQLLNINILKLEIYRRKISNLSYNQISEKKNDNLIILPEEIQKFMKEVIPLIEKYTERKYSFREHWNFSLFELYEVFFHNVNNTEKRVYDWEYKDRIAYVFFFPDYYKRFLYSVINYDYKNQIYEQLKYYELTSLDRDSQLEYILKLCTDKIEIRDYRIRGEQICNIYINLRTLIDYALMLNKEVKNIEISKKAEDLKLKILGKKKSRKKEEEGDKRE